MKKFIVSISDEDLRRKKFDDEFDDVTVQMALEAEGFVSVEVSEVLPGQAFSIFTKTSTGRRR